MAIIARVTRFINADVLAEPLRDWVVRRYGADSRPAYLMTCPWCASIWVAAVVVPLAVRFGDRWWLRALGVGAAASYLYGLTAEHLDAD